MTIKKPEPYCWVVEGRPKMHFGSDAKEEAILHAKLYAGGSYPIPKAFPLYRYHSDLPAREWVRLTDKEKADTLWGPDDKTLDYEDYADAIEAKLKEKNNG